MTDGNHQPIPLDVRGIGIDPDQLVALDEALPELQLIYALLAGWVEANGATVHDVHAKLERLSDDGYAATMEALPLGVVLDLLGDIEAAAGRFA